MLCGIITQRVEKAGGEIAVHRRVRGLTALATRVLLAHTRCAGGTVVDAGAIAEGDASLMPHARHVGSAVTTSRRAVLAGGATVAAAFLAAAAPHAQAQDGTPEPSVPLPPFL